MREKEKKEKKKAFIKLAQYIYADYIDIGSHGIKLRSTSAVPFLFEILDIVNEA